MENIESKLIDLIDGKLEADERAEVEKQIAANAEIKQLYNQLKEVISQLNTTCSVEPTSKLRNRFDQMLKEEITDRNQPRGRQIFLNAGLLRIAAGVVLMLMGAGIFLWVSKNQQQQREIARLRFEMDSTKNAMLNLLRNQQSASQRVLGTTVAFQMPSADDEIVNALVKAMNEDPNTNVRLAALDALGKFKHDQRIRKLLITSLSTQTDPVVQISLIQLMVEMKEKSILKELEEITRKKEVLKAVKDEAYSGILKLS
jgi:flagellar basal body-associated protein FliL